MRPRGERALAGDEDAEPKIRPSKKETLTPARSADEKAADRLENAQRQIANLKKKLQNAQGAKSRGSEGSSGGGRNDSKGGGRGGSRNNDEGRDKGSKKRGSKGQSIRGGKRKSVPMPKGIDRPGIKDREWRTHLF